jgi:hypothetical protein
MVVPIVLLEESLERSDNCAGYRSVLGLSRLSVTRLRLGRGLCSCRSDISSCNVDMLWLHV